MGKMSNFQLIVSGIFIVFIVLGVATFALFTASNKSSVGRVVIWGTADQGTMEKLISAMDSQDKSFQDVSYVQKSPATYESDLVNALASGAGPDLFMITQDDVSSFANKVITIPYQDFPQQTFVDSYVPEGQLFLTSQGELALPFLIDPLVMYWNRDLLATAGVAAPPQYWNGFLDLAPKLTSLGSSSSIEESAVAMGLWSNITDAKAILSALFMQAGDPIVEEGSTGLVSVFGTTPSGASENPASSALNFYTQFANPQKTSYSWNRSLPSSQDAFVAGTVGVYFGFASEYNTLASRNPNLHFGVALLPQLQGSATHLTYGTLTGLAISRASQNAQGALTIAEKLTSQAGVVAAAQETGLPPVRTDVSQDTSGSAPASIFAQSSLIARGWLDPDSAQTDSVFQGMVESVISGGSQPDQAVSQAGQSLQSLVRQTQ